MKRVGYIVIFVALGISVLVGLLRLNQVWAAAENLVDNSPTPFMSEITTSFSSPSRDGATDVTRHILISSDHGDAYTVKLGLYYPVGISGPQTVQIEGGGSTYCQFWQNPTDGAPEIANTRNVYRMYFNGYTTSAATPGGDTYLKNYGQACNGIQTRTQYFTIPASVISSAPVDASTNNLYRKVTMSITLACGMRDQLRAGPTCGTTYDNNVDGHMSFSVRAWNALVGLVDTAESQSAPNNTFVPQRGIASEQIIRQIIPFGLNCTEGTQPSGEVVLYDADNGQGSNNLTFQVQHYVGSGWVTLPQGTTPNTVRAGQNVTFVSGPAGMARPNNSPVNSNQKASVFINQLNAREQYRIVVWGLRMVGYNYIYVGLPGDSIFGTSSIACEQRASPGLTLSPSDYVAIGGAATTTGSIDNRDNTATAALEYNHSIWYGSANNDYNASDGDQGIQQTGWRAINVGAGLNPNVNTFTWPNVQPPAGIRYVCAKMEIRNRGLDDTQLPVPPHIIRCTPIAKAPSFAATAGGVRTGGNYGMGTCSVARPAAIATDSSRLAHYFGVVAHDYVNMTPTTPYHAYARDSILTLGYTLNTVSKKSGVGNGTDIALHFARAGVPTATTSLGGGLFYGASGSTPDVGIFPLASVASANAPNPIAPVKTHCLTNLFEADRYAASTMTVPITATTPVNLPNPVAGVMAITYNICGDAPNKMLSLRGPAGGDLQLGPGQQYIVRITQEGINCNLNPVFVRLDSNIRYTGTAATINQLPQFVFLAGTTASSRVSIHVSNGVTRLDGIYANRGTSNTQATFLTCAERANGAPRDTFRLIATSDCTNQLRVNGAIVLGGRLNPYRTFGHGSAGDTEPAEVFNLRPDTILSDYARDHSSSQLEVVNQRELAPRF